MKRMVSWILTCVLLLTLLPAGAWAAEPLKVTPKVDAGYNFCVALDENGTVWTWGENNHGQLGDGTWTERHYAMPVLEGVVDIDASGNSVMAMKADGTFWAWGEGGKQLGVGYVGIDVKKPEQVILPKGSSVKEFALNCGSSMFLMDDGTVWTWGGYQRPGSAVSNREPYHVSELDDANVTSLTGSDYRGVCIAICGSGTPEDPSKMYFWGEDAYDWCLDGDDDFIVDVPRQVVFSESEYLTYVQTGEGTIFARVGGPEPGIYAWGRNDYCQAGVGQSAGGGKVTVPNKIAGYHSSAPLYVTSGWGSNPVVFHEDGTLWTWGYDELLMPPHTGTNIPVLTKPEQIDVDHVVEAAQGSRHLVALRKDGLVYVRGTNEHGQRGAPEHLGEFGGYEFDFTRPVQKQDGTPLSLRNFDGPVHFLTVKVNAKQGVVAGSAPDAYQAGDMITLTAQSKEGWVFTGWSAEGVTLADATSPTISFAMPASDVTVTALFEKDLTGMTGSGSFQGEIGEPDPDAISISTAEQLVSIGSGYPLDGSYVLTADLDLASYENWTPIGSNEAPFTGTFDGQGHVVTGLTIDGRLERAGLFGKVNEKGVIKNLGLERVSINVSGSIDGDCYVGGIVGQMGVNQGGYNTGSTAEMRNCYVTGEITAQLSRGDLYLGGLAGELDADVSDCFNAAALSGGAGSSTLKSNTLYMGGLTGWIGTYLQDPYVVERCFNEGELTPSATQNTAYVGGVVGYLSNRVVFRQCCNTADVWMSPRYTCGRLAYLGGIAGFSDSSISDCYNLGDVGAEQGYDAAFYEMACGGIVGYSALGESGMEYEITNCYTAGKVIARSYYSAWAGGIVGNVVENYATLTAKHCLVLSPSIGSYYDYVMGSTGGTTFKADVLGTRVRMDSSSRSYYLDGIKSEGSGSLTYPSGAYKASDDQVTDQAWYDSRVGWDFEEIWLMAEEQNNGLPYFTWIKDGYQIRSYDGKEVEVYSRLAGGNVLLCAASYDEDGRMVSTAAVQTDLVSGDNTISLPLEQVGAETKVYLWRAANLKPLVLPYTV